MCHTFVICTYGNSPYIEECIKSIKNQTVASRVIISTATNSEYINKISLKYNIPLHINAHSPDIALDWNSAIEIAKTKYVTIAHQDDIYEINYVAKVLEKAESCDRTQIVFTDYYEIRNNEKCYLNTNLMIKRLLLYPLRIKKLQSVKSIKRNALRFGNAICCPSVTYVKANIHEPLFSKGMQSNVDWIAWERLSREKGGFCYIPHPLMGHRIHGQSTTSITIREDKRSIEDLMILEKFWPKYIAMILNKIYQCAEWSNVKI